MFPVLILSGLLVAALAFAVFALMGEDDDDVTEQ
jgi:hypothetical protein